MKHDPGTLALILICGTLVVGFIVILVNWHNRTGRWL